MDLSLHISPAGDTTPREISTASQEVRNILERLPGVEGLSRNGFRPRIKRKEAWST